MVRRSSLTDANIASRQAIDEYLAYSQNFYRRFLKDFPVCPISNIWRDVLMTGFSEDKVYVVQSSQKVVQRCILMATDPGDLVLDPTCGSGTTASVAEQWGRVGSPLTPLVWRWRPHHGRALSPRKQAGTIIVSVTDEVFSADNPEHVEIANRIEIRLVDQDLLPRYVDI